MLAEQIADHLDATGALPTDRHFTIEERDDALVLNSCQGSKINEALGHFLLAMASTKSGKWGRLVVEPTRVALQSADVRPEDIMAWLLETPPDAIEHVLSITVPNSRQVRWRFAQVAKIFGVLRHGVDPRRINLQALLRKYKGTVVMEEVLSKLFHERMDVKGAGDVLHGLQSGVLSIEVTAQGPLGMSNTTQNQMLLPNWDNAAIRERLKLRLTNERAVLCCLRCHGVRRFLLGHGKAGFLLEMRGEPVGVRSRRASGNVGEMGEIRGREGPGQDDEERRFGGQSRFGSHPVFDGPGHR